MNNNEKKSLGSILCVDDDSTIRQLIVCYFEECGFAVYEAETAEDAMPILTEKKPDIVLCDLKMPGIGGLAFLKYLKEHAPETPFIVISGEGDFNDAIEALRLGAWDYVVKPFTHSILEHAVYRAFKHLKLVKENIRQKLELKTKNIELAISLTQLKEDQKAGKNVQQQLLPRTNTIYSDYHFSYKVYPSLSLSGDFVDYFEINDNQVAFYIADVSGHGASSAFVTALLKGLVSQMLSIYQLGYNEVILNPEQVLKQLSDSIINAKLGKYLTMIYCVLDVKTNTLTYSVGGHYPNPIIWDGNSTVYLKGEGYAVGTHKNAVYQAYTHHIAPKSILMLFSDGIFEVLKGVNNAEKEQQLLALIKKHNYNTQGIANELNINEGNNLPDDISLLLMRKDGTTNDAQHTRF